VLRGLQPAVVGALQAMIAADQPAATATPPGK
jgi:hypothetical protein